MKTTITGIFAIVVIQVTSAVVAVPDMELIHQFAHRIEDGDIHTSYGDSSPLSCPDPIQNPCPSYPTLHQSDLSSPPISLLKIYDPEKFPATIFPDKFDSNIFPDLATQCSIRCGTTSGDSLYQNMIIPDHGLTVCYSFC